MYSYANAQKNYDGGSSSSLGRRDRCANTSGGWMQETGRRILEDSQLVVLVAFPVEATKNSEWQAFCKGWEVLMFLSSLVSVEKAPHSPNKDGATHLLPHTCTFGHLLLQHANPNCYNAKRERERECVCVCVWNRKERNE